MVLIFFNVLDFFFYFYKCSPRSSEIIRNIHTCLMTC